MLPRVPGWYLPSERGLSALVRDRLPVETDIPVSPSRMHRPPPSALLALTTRRHGSTVSTPARLPMTTGEHSHVCIP